MNPTSPAFALRLEGGGAELVRLAAGEAASIGRDPQNRAQLAHGSIEPFHARLRCDEWGVWLSVVPGATAKVRGEPVVDERLVPPGAVVELGALRFELVPWSGPSAAAPTPAGGSSGSSAWRRRIARTVDRLVGYVVSLVLHAAALWLLHRLVVEKALPPAPLALRSDSVIEPDRDFAVQIPPEPAHPELLPEPEPEIEPLTDVEPPDPTPPTHAGVGQADDPELIAAVRALGTGTLGGESGMSGIGRLSLDGDVSGVGSAVVARLQALRGAGVDLVFAIDTTSSMQPFLDQARTAADNLVTTLSTLVGDLRVGVVAYRDAGDTYVTKVLPPSADRYAILNFLWTLRADGGGDVPEGIADGLAAAVAAPNWRGDTHRVIVVIGDAPPHQRDWSRIKQLIGSFVRGDPKRIPGAIVSAIYTGPPREGVKPEEDGAKALAELAGYGRGDYLDLAGNADVGDRLVATILGPHHVNELRVLMSRVRDGPREALVRQKVAEGDTKWLLAKLRRPPVHPLIVEALIDQADRAVLWDARRLMTDREEPREVREAALYLLRRHFPLALEVDLGIDPELQRPLLDRLDAQIFRR